MAQKDTFLEYYKKLNPEQKRAVNEIDGPVAVIAGPGTGKTQILTLRIANILRKTDTDARNILALTFTESGVAAMRKRLSEIIGETAYSVSIHTFHGFCNDVIKEHPEEFPRIIGSRNITEVEQIQIIEEIVDSRSFQLLKPFGSPFHYISSILSNINSLKREGIGVDDFSRSVKRKKQIFSENSDLYYETGARTGKMKGAYKDLEKNILKNEEFSFIYGKYEKILAKRKLYDYSDMIMEVSRALLSNEDLLLTLQERYQYFLVDEHQDTNRAQNKVLELLTSFYPNPNLFIVGDEKQAIFRFQGASPENFLYFQKLYPDTKKIILRNNYRSTQQILDSAHGIAEKMKQTHSAPLTGKESKGKKIGIRSFSTQEAELFWLMSDIKEKFTRGVRPDEIAILYRNNNDAFPIADVCEKIGISYSLESDQNILEDTDIQKLMLILSSVEHFGSDIELLEAIHIDFLKIHPLDIYKILRHSGESKRKISIYDVISSRKILDELGIESKETILDFYHHLALWKTMDQNNGLVAVSEHIIQNSGFLPHIAALENAFSKIEKTNALFDEIKKIVEGKRNAKLKDFFLYLKTLQDHHLSIKKTVSGVREGNVRLMTAHRSKGQEFGYVYIVYVNDGHWGNKHASNLLPLVALYDENESEELKLDDERRLFYVAITRAQHEVSISYFLKNNNGKDQLPSQFIYEMSPDLTKIIDIKHYEDEYKKHPFFAMPRVSQTQLDEKDFIRELFLNRGFAATHLNNYLRCPWKYFYVNLLRIPQAKTKYQMYGTAVHGALKDFFDALSEKKKNINKTYLINLFKKHLNEEYLSEGDYQESEGKGEGALAGWYDAYHGSWGIRAVITEKNIQGVFLDERVRLTGKIDKMEITSASNDVVVTDYKTSKPKSRNEIEGKTKSSNCDIKRQLVFYKLLLDRFENGRYTMRSAIVNFIEPDEKGKYRREEFEITKGEVKELEELIKKTVDNILSFSFENSTCGEKDCKYCKLRGMM